MRPFQDGSTGSSPVGSIPKEDRVPNEPFRERFLELSSQGVTAYSILSKAGMPPRATNYLKCLLGLKQYHSSKTGKYYFSSHMRYAVAVRLANAMDMDILELGI